MTDYHFKTSSHPEILTKTYQVTYKDTVLNIFKQRPDIFPENEIKDLESQLSIEGTDKHLKIVAEINNTIVGYCGACLNNELNRWELDWFSVDKDYQGKGVGGWLLTEVKIWLSSKNVPKLYVQTCSCDGEKNARRFYENNGFILISTEIDGYNVGHNKLTYELTL